MTSSDYTCLRWGVWETSLFTMLGGSNADTVQVHCGRGPGGLWRWPAHWQTEVTLTCCTWVAGFRWSGPLRQHWTSSFHVLWCKITVFINGVWWTWRALPLINPRSILSHCLYSFVSFVMTNRNDQHVCCPDPLSSSFSRRRSSPSVMSRRHPHTNQCLYSVMSFIV